MADRDDQKELTPEQRFHRKRSQKAQNRPTVLQELQNELILVLNRYDLPVSTKFSVMVSTAVMEAGKEKSVYQIADILRQQASIEENRHLAPSRQ